MSLRKLRQIRRHACSLMSEREVDDLAAALPDCLTERLSSFQLAIVISTMNHQRAMAVHATWAEAYQLHLQLSEEMEQ